MHGNLLKFLNIFKLYFCFFLLLGKKIYLSRETAIVVTSRGTSCNIWKQPCCTSWVAVAVISSTGEVCRGYSRLLPICDAFFIQRGRRSLPILRKKFFLIDESDDGHRIKRALYIGIKRLWQRGPQITKPQILRSKRL